jgi:hypothetical protein
VDYQQEVLRLQEKERTKAMHPETAELKANKGKRWEY